MKEAFEQEDIPAVPRGLARDWKTRKRMLPAMTTPAIERWIREARRQGAMGARVCGAGGGGCLAMIIDPDQRAQLQALAESHGVRVLPVKIVHHGLRVK